VQEVYAANIEVSDADKEKIVALKEAPRVPGYHEDAAGNDDTEDLRRTVEQKIAVEAGQVNPNERHEKRKGPKKLHRGSGQVQEVICCSAIVVLSMSQNLPPNGLRRDAKAPPTCSRGPGCRDAWQGTPAMKLCNEISS